ncbi:beta family protein [Mucilaginibacter jinjuensis]|uniref:Beta family protein n=1 Tax=Mucilaginibacter jinjuensis TaxID=1176721 RepID=A0ABY7T796_9SPHI|nr:beta family protein [Mucilaginibacter jinjuensis]WCT11562.1 beta family protein [Mucilaginibacter jinjuensis]
MNNQFYVPILKAKYGEFQALGKLSIHVTPHVCPLIELTKVAYDHQEKKTPLTIEEHLNKTAKKLIEHWPRSRAFIDMTQIAHLQADGNSTIEYFYKRLFEKGLTPLPVFRINSPELLLEGIAKIQKKYSITGAGIRITLTDLSSPQLKSNLDKAIAGQSASISDIHLVIDLAAPENFEDLDALSDAIVSRMEVFPYFQNWASVSVCSSAYPDPKLVKKEINYFPRHEWVLYGQIAEEMHGKSFYREINYGDYSIVAPGHFDFDPIRMTTAAKMIYTTTENYIFLKGKSLKNKGFRQYIDQASEIVNADYYLGEQFSAGDWQLKRCCTDQKNTGTATTWNWVGNNHHITKVVNDLFASRSVA